MSAKTKTQAPAPPTESLEPDALISLFTERRTRFGGKSRRMFRYLDENSDGVITRDDLQKRNVNDLFVFYGSLMLPRVGISIGV